MGRPKVKRCNCCAPKCKCFKPEGPSKKGLSGVDLGSDEFTAIKLHDVNGLNQQNASKEMKISQPTFARILTSAHKKISSAIIGGEEIRIQ
jgi:predicted DNA-binding protein (UPF0251 family)